MSNASPVSMQELQMESADLLPGRETLCVGIYQIGLLNVAIGNVSLYDLIPL